MAALEQQIDAIVREVLAQLQAAPGGKKTQSKNANSGGELAIESRVVTAAQLVDRLAGVKQLTLRRGAIVTPAVRDLLREKGIAVHYRDRPVKSTVSGSASVVLGLASTPFDPAALVRDVNAQGVAVERVASSGLATVVAELADAIVRGGKLAILLTAETMAALCLANRRIGVRAVQATSYRCVAIGAKAVGANLLVVQPKGRSTFELKRIITTFAELGPQPCPAELAATLS